MKKVFTILLALCLLLSLSGTAMATESSTITYSADETAWDIEVSPTVQTKEHGVVLVTGYWAPDMCVNVVADATEVKMTSENGDTFNVSVTFDGISEPGADLTATVPTTVQKSFVVDKDGKMDVIKFGRWSGTLTFTAQLVPNTNYVPGEQDSLIPPTVVEVSAVSDLSTELNKAGSNAGNTIISITQDIDMTGTTWTPVYVNGYGGSGIVTVNGNGNELTGLTAPLFKGGFAGDSGIIINDLTINASKIDSTGTVGSGAFIENIDSMKYITLDNCHLMNSTVNGSRTGGLVGYVTGYGNVNDGAQPTPITIVDCSVENCTITNTIEATDSTTITPLNSATESVGAIVGHASGSSWTFTNIENCLVKDTKLVGGVGKTGLVIGTSGAGTVTITGCTFEGTNTINGKSVNVGDTTTFYGRTGFSTGSSLTINGNPITA